MSMKEMTKNEAREPKLLLDDAVDQDQLIVLETESLTRPLPTTSELGKSLHRIEDRAMKNASILRGVHRTLSANSEKISRKVNSSAFFGALPLPLHFHSSDERLRHNLLSRKS
jgi:hypothetical protein